MQRTKKLLSLFMALVLLMSTFGAFELSAVAATDDTRYSKKYLQNGGFETLPDATKTKIGESGYTQPFKSTIEYWDTTAYGKSDNGTQGQFEFLGAKSNGAAPPHFNFSSSNKVVAEGNYAAELNADENSTIYQRIETVSGSTYTWGLDHRGRDTTDTMVLFIGPEQYKEDRTTPIDPSKPGRVNNDQFVRMTNWLKTQYGVTYPDEGCSQKYTIYSKPFAEKGKFRNETQNEDENFSMTKTEECSQEWSLWVISSKNNNTSTDEFEAVKGWSKYGTNCYDENDDSYNDVIKGAGSKLGYDCTYTVPKGQTKTLFAFTSFSGTRKSGNTLTDDITYGNLLDDISFKLYQPVSSSITEGGTGGASTGNTVISSDIKNSNMLYTTVNDGNECTIHTKLTDGKSGHTFQGAYVTTYDAAGNPTTKFVDTYTGDTTNLTDDKMLELSKTYFMPDDYYNHEGGEKWDFFYTISVDSPVHIHMMYTKAPYVLYDSNGGEPYQWTEDNSVGGNLIGFRDGFKGLVGVDSKDYYVNANVNEITDEQTGTTILETVDAGFYKSHPALPNSKWQINDSGIGAKFINWTFNDADGNIVNVDGNHTITYAPNETEQGAVTISDGKNNVGGLTLDATNGITLTAQWKFGYTAQAQTLVGHSLEIETQTWENSAVGGWVEETYINDRSNVEDHKEVVNGIERVERTDAYGSVGEKIIFRATADTANDYVFDGWYTIDKNGTATLVTTTPNLAISVEQGKSETYYARFKTKTVPVIFHYSELGMANGYDYYEKSAEYKYGKYFQDVVYNEYAIQPTGDSKKVSIWYTSPTERDQEHVFNFTTTPITKETHLYASPSFTFNYYNYFRFAEPWKIDVTATLKFDGKYIDITKDANITDYNVYTKKADTITASAPLPSEVKSKPTTKAGKKVNSSKIITSTLTNKTQTFNRIGSTFNDFYLFNMRKPVWVVFDFTYKGITYTTPIKNRCLYNCIGNYKVESDKGLHYTSYPSKTQTEVRDAYTTMLYSIRAMHDAINPDVNNPTIVEPTEYKQSSAVSGLTYDEANTLEFVSSTAIRNIEPWGLKYIFGLDPITETETGSGETTESGSGETTETTPTVVNDSITNYTDYGVVMFTDYNNEYSTAPTVTQILENENAVMYSKSKNNISRDDETGKIVVYYVNNLKATDFDKNTYAVFFAKDSTGTYFSSVVANSYKTVAGGDTISTSIITYSDALLNYRNKVKEAEQALAN